MARDGRSRRSKGCALPQDSKAASRISVTFHNASALPAVYRITEDLYQQAVSAHDGLGELLDVRVVDDANDVDRILKDTHVLVASLMDSSLPRERLAESRNLRWVHFIGAGVDHLLPLDWLPSGAVLTKSLGAHLPNAVEYGVMALLMLNNNLPHYASCQRNRRWERVFSTSIGGKCLAIIGAGSIGGALATEAKRLGLKVLGVRRSGLEHKDVDQMFLPDQLHQVLPLADFIFVSAALTPATRGLIGREALALMKPGAGLISIARGAVLDFEALAESLRSGHLGGAVVNAFPTEPLPASSSLWETPNLIITPHIGTQDKEKFSAKVLQGFLLNMERYTRGEPLHFQVDAERGY